MYECKCKYINSKYLNLPHVYAHLLFCDQHLCIVMDLYYRVMIYWFVPGFKKKITHDIESEQISSN